MGEREEREGGREKERREREEREREEERRRRGEREERERGRKREGGEREGGIEKEERRERELDVFTRIILEPIHTHVHTIPINISTSLSPLVQVSPGLVESSIVWLLPHRLCCGVALFSRTTRRLTDC